MTKPITRSNTRGQLALIWECLHEWRENTFDETTQQEADEKWNEVTSAMAFIAEDLGEDLSTIDGE